MRNLATLFIFAFAILSVKAQVPSQRLMPSIVVSTNDICPNDEVQIDLAYQEPDNTSLLLNGIDELGNVPALPAFDFGATADFSIEFFIKTSANRLDTQWVVSKANWGDVGYGVFLEQGKIGFYISDGANNVYFSGFQDITDSQWHHVAIVAGRNSNATIYIDGAYDNDAPINFVGNCDNTENVRIGAINTGVGVLGHLTGFVDELRIWNVALTTGQITTRNQIHINPNSAANPNLVGYWDFNDLNMPQFLDCSPTGATGTATNAASLSADAPVLGWNFLPLWSNGQNTQSIFVSPEDTTQYKVDIGYCKYYSTDSVTINVIECEDDDNTGRISSVWIPNAFSPNGDFKNDEFLVQGVYLTYYEIMIYNRFGNIIYHSRNIENAWDGTFEGELVQTGVYTYIVRYRDLEGEEFTEHGTVTVVDAI